MKCPLQFEAHLNTRLKRRSSFVAARSLTPLNPYRMLSTEESATHDTQSAMDWQPVPGESPFPMSDFPIITSGLKPTEIDLAPQRRRPTVRQLKAGSKYEPEQENAKGPRECSRNYQRDILERAKIQNIIAVMDTGTGKTLPAAHLIKHMLALEEVAKTEETKKRIAIFLVPTVPLVWQQKDYLKHQIEANVAPLCGDMMSDDKHQTWIKLIKENGILCATAQVIVEALNHAFLTMDQICLIVFDEAHHAIGDHPYSVLMKEHYWCTPTKLRPKIMGLTASPVASDSQALVAIENLEKILDCQAMTITLSPEESARFAARAKPERVHFRSSKDNFEAPPVLQKIEAYRYKMTGINLEKAAQDGNYILHQLGPWACSRTLITALDQLQTRADRAILDRNGMKYMHDQADIERQRRNLQRELQECRPGDEPQDSEISAKVHKLIEVLEAYRNDPTFSGIVFVQRRETAERLRDLLTQYPKTASFIRAGTLMGNRVAKPDDFDLTMRLTEQSTILREFRKHRLNLMVATKVAEEGLDIPSCKLVVRFDMGKDNMNLVNFIQCRGRARAPDSRFVIMLEKDNWEHSTHLRALKSREQDVRDQISRQGERVRTTETITDLCEEDVVTTQPYSYVVESSGARVSLTSAIPVLHHFCSILEVDEYTRAQPEYACMTTAAVGEDDAYTASITLPNILPIDMRFVTGLPMRSRALAYRVAALQAVKLLHERKYLDSHLRPVFDKTYCHMNSGKLEDEDIERLKTDLLSLKSKKKKGNYSITLAEILLKPWRPTQSPVITAHLNIVDVAFANGAATTSRLGFLSVGQLPISPLNFLLWPNLIEHKVRLQSSVQELQLSLEQYEMVRSYSYSVLSPMLKDKLFKEDSDYSMLMVPLHDTAGHVIELDSTFDAASLIDWQTISDCVTFDPDANRQRMLYTSDITECVLSDHRQFKRKFFALERLDNKGPFSPVPFMDPKFVCAADYYTMIKNQDRIKLHQPVIRARLVTRKFNMLACHTIAEVESVDAKRDGDVFLLPQFCKPYPICQSTMRASIIFPSILYYTEVACRAAELRDKLDLPVTLPKLIEALAAPSAVLQNSYERLETLGDAFLKIAITLHLYALHPYRHEGVMTMMSHRLQSNYALYQQGVKRGVPGYITSAKLTRTTWRPMVTSKGWEEDSMDIDGLDDEDSSVEPMIEPVRKKEEPSAVSMVHRLSTKQIADTVESILGACLDDNGIKGAAQALHNIYHEGFLVNWGDYVHALVDLPKPQGEMRPEKKVYVDRVQELTGYTFKNPWLLAEALTHPSSPDMVVQNYQRLEFLGDAILGLLAVQHFYHKYPELPPGRLTDLKDAAVNNSFLACVSANLGLHYYIDRFSAPMDQDIADYCAELYSEAQRHEANAEAREALLTASRLGNFASKAERNKLQRQLEAEMQYWINIETPKAMSDVFEAILGAVFVDNDFSEAAVWEFMRRNWLPWVDKYVQPHIVGRHPYRELAMYLRSNLQCDAWRVPTKHDADGHLYVANLIVHQEVVMACSGSSRKAARRLLAETVMERLDEEPGFLSGYCDCSRTRERDDDVGGEELVLEKDVATLHGC